MTDLLDELYNPALTDLALNDYRDEERPVVYLDDVKEILKHYRSIESIREAIGEDEDGWTNFGKNDLTTQESARNKLRADIRRKLGL